MVAAYFVRFVHTKAKTLETGNIMAVKVTKAAGIASDAVQAKTGKSWDQWFSILDKAGAKGWTHKEIAEFLHEEHECPPWWSQMVTVGYEQERGLRVKNQSCDGDFSASASKTIAVPIGDLFKHWNDTKLRRKWLPDSAKITVRKVNANKNMRITWPDDTSVEVNFWDKGAEKSQAAVEHRKLKSTKDVERIKSYWAKALVALQTMLEGSTALKARTPAGLSRVRKSTKTK